MADALPGTIVERDEVVVLFRRVPDVLSAIQAGWAEVEGIVGLRGRRFYGAVDRATSEYLVCVQAQEADDADALGLERGTLPGGRYARVVLQGEPPAVYDRIGTAFRELARRPDTDPSRPPIEFYRRRDTIELLEPVH
jgi:hypothetical protein